MRMQVIAAVLIAVGCGRASGPTRVPVAAPADRRAAPAVDSEGAGASGPWGPAVPAPAVEAQVRAMLHRLGDGAPAPSDLGAVLMLGPGLWSSWQLAGLNSAAGIPVMGRVPVGDRVVVAHGRAVRGAAVAPFVASDVVRATARYFADGEVGPASGDERGLYHAGIAWDIAGEPVTVVRKADETLVVILDDEGRLFELETLGPWHRLMTGTDSEIERYQPAAGPP